MTKIFLVIMMAISAGCSTPQPSDLTDRCIESQDTEERMCETDGSIQDVQETPDGYLKNLEQD